MKGTAPNITEKINVNTNNALLEKYFYNFSMKFEYSIEIMLY